MSLIFKTRRLIKPEDLNGQNALFGGRLLSWIDEECYIYCACQMESNNIVTKYISELNLLRRKSCPWTRLSLCLSVKTENLRRMVFKRNSGLKLLVFDLASA